MSEDDIKRAFANAVPFTPEKTAKKGNGQAAGPTVELLPGTAYNVEPVRWLWADWLAVGKLHLLAGMAGTGKTTIAVGLAATITSGATWPDGLRVEPGDVLMWSGEDDVKDTLLPRLLACGGDPRRFHFVASIWEGDRSRHFDPAVDVPALVGAAKQLASLKLVIVDPVVAAVMGDSHKNAETRRGLQPLVDLAAALNCAVLGISHFTKNTSGREPLDRVTGSLAFGAVARIVLATVKDADPAAPRRLVRVKSNLGPDGGGFEYSLSSAQVPGELFPAQCVDWGGLLQGTARELLEVEKPDEGGALEAAEAFLGDLLESGPKPTSEIKVAAMAKGVAWATVRRAKDSLGLEVRKAGFKGCWAWQLPDPPKMLKAGAEDA